MRHKFILTFFSSLMLVVANAQNVGIGTAAPLARLHVTDSSVLFSAAGYIPSTPHDAPIGGAGRRMMWYPDKAAFRAGAVSSTYWDTENIGDYSFACGYDAKANAYGSISMGFQPTASGAYSTAMGSQPTASGEYSTAMGSQTTASGRYSTAMGYHTTASEYISTAMGYITTASGGWSTAMGYNTTASGNYSIAMGEGAIASGSSSTAMGSQTTASGDNSTAMGYNVSTGGEVGSFVIGDADPAGAGLTKVSVTNQFVSRFYNGYYLLTSSNSYPRTGVLMNHGDNSWSAISDSTKKEKMLPIDEEDFLKKIAQFKLSTWNYKGQDPKAFRHYGPMAQDFHNAFGKDALGTIGCDTLINQQDFLGVSFIAVQALEKRTQKIEEQQKQISDLQKQNIALQQQVNNQQQDNIAMKEQMRMLLSTVASLNKQVQAFATRINKQNTIAVK